ncbi:uncharacterized protein FOMMEDRAFT_124369 [Fomitiporia mediterranea MF3/22]|uniref:uncharacterized protein n=1 Tax=Fomitiporia mediterranea (strain MF3/22) TaxID=694068 RepID=UPI00044081A1|nr:uncharacterized protein FOMMEDRAFT_124369 [Fomitiporia mediterranea MF3/22]EJD02116.1 hypothetical protein FOMMEDRAFT_124369 [Fomitiporia mediterranea MF3/22]
MTSTSPTPPDLSTLSISPQAQSLHDNPYDYNALQSGQNQRQQPFHFSTSPAIPGQMPYNPLGLGQSPLKNKPTARAGLPAQWIDSQVLNDSRSMSPPSNSDISSGGSPPLHQMQVPMQQQQQALPTGNPEDEIIPTAIVIKNIPFNVKRETLLDIIASLSIPTPYAFNYHLDAQGAFRGLAFANFRQPQDADAVVAALNGFDVQGRKLRVEYKKVLQAGEKERIEREKALRRMRSMQLEKEQQAMQQQQVPSLNDFGAVGGGMYGTPRSVSSPYTNPYQHQENNSPPMPVPQPYGVGSPVAPPPPTTPSTRGSSNELDLNDASTLEIYSRILLFKDDPMRDELAFSRTLSPKQRRVVHLVAQKLGVFHYSVGEGEERYAVVTRIDPERVNHNMQAEPRRTLSRAPSTYNMTAPQVSASSLRSKKSMPDMKTLHTQAPRLHSRASNGNLGERYNTIASPSRRSPGSTFGSIFGNSAFSSSGVPPVPSLPSTLSTPLNLNGNGTIRENEVSSSNVVRQPRGPSAGSGFMSRRDRISASESATQGLEARSHEPLEI